MRRLLIVPAAAIALLSGAANLPDHDSRRAQAASLTGVHKIRHMVVVMQENRSFDSYFGTYPGATAGSLSASPTG